MAQWTRLPTGTHQLTLAGKVVDARSRAPVAGVTVSITQPPPTFARWLSARALQHGAAWDTLPRRPDRVLTAEDGGFAFADLPDGDYTLAFALAKGGHRYGAVERTFSLARDAEGRLQAPLREVLLPPTGVRGLVQGLVQGVATALPLARVRVEHSGETTHAEADGRFFLTGVQPGPQVLRVSASGFQAATPKTVITEGQLTDLATVVLNPLS